MSANNLGFPVATQVPAHHLGPENAIRCLPGCRFTAQQCKFDGKLTFLALNGGVNTTRIGIENALAMLTEARHLFFCRTMHTQAATESVGFNRYLAKNL